VRKRAHDAERLAYISGARWFIEVATFLGLKLERGPR